MCSPSGYLGHDLAEADGGLGIGPTCCAVEQPDLDDPAGYHHEPVLLMEYPGLVDGAS